LSHHHPGSVSLLVLDKMKQDNIHASIVKLNEGLLDSYFELSDMGIRSSHNGWQNIVRLAWMCAARLRKKRMARVKNHLKTLPTRSVLELSHSKVKALIDGEHTLAKALIEEGEVNDADLLDY
jgi:hypothetical protein